jgi:hypothetical protein
MAFTKTPVNSTYTTKSVGLAKELGSRGTTSAKDSYMRNCYVEMQKNKDTQDKEMLFWMTSTCMTFKPTH